MSKPQEKVYQFPQLLTDIPDVLDLTKHQVVECSTCKYWPITEENQLVASCHRFPQEIFKKGDEWCGEWKLRQ